MTARTPHHRHPLFSGPWLREASTGVVIGIAFLQLAPGFGSGVAGSLTPWGHATTGVLLLFLVPLVLIGHPMPPPGRSSSRSCDPLHPPTKLLGLLSLLGFAGLAASGMLMAWAPATGLLSLLPGRLLHGLCARVLAFALPVHLGLAVLLRHRRWKRQWLQDPKRRPRYRAGWWPACLAVLGLSLLRRLLTM